MNKLKNKKKYFKFNKLINKKYNFKEYNSLLKPIFELQFRLIEKKEGYIADRNYKKFLNRKLKFRFIIKKLFFFYLSVIYFLSRGSNIFIRSSVMSEELEIDFKKKLKKFNINTVGTLSYRQDIFSFLKYISLGTWYYDICERTLEINHTLTKYNCYDIFELIKLQNNKSFNFELKNSYQKDINYISKVQKKMNLTGALINTDQTPFGVLFAKAAHKNNINTAILAHGNFRNPYLISVLPLNAKRIFVWSKQTELLINSTYQKKVSEKIAGIKNNIVKKNPYRNNILFAASPVNQIIKNKKKKIFLKILKYLSQMAKPAKLIYCMHPEDSKTELSKLFKNLKITISAKSIYNEATKAKIVLGSHSSFLFESIKSGIKAIQIKDICINPKQQKIEGVPQIKFEKFFNKNFLDSNFKIKLKKEKLDTNKLIKFYKKNKNFTST